VLQQQQLCLECVGDGHSWEGQLPWKQIIKAVCMQGEWFSSSSRSSSWQQDKGWAGQLDVGWRVEAVREAAYAALANVSEPAAAAAAGLQQPCWQQPCWQQLCWQQQPAAASSSSSQQQQQRVDAMPAQHLSCTCCM
jgi:hypothetical protein